MLTIDATQFQQLPNACQLNHHIIAGGLPSQEDLKIAKAQGINILIDLRHADEGVAATAAFATQHHFTHYHLPITPDSLSLDHADQFANILKECGNAPILLHCASGLRTIALWALYQFKHKSQKATTALNEAQNNGLTHPMFLERLRILMKDKSL